MKGKTKKRREEKTQHCCYYSEVHLLNSLTSDAAAVLGGGLHWEKLTMDIWDLLKNGDLWPVFYKHKTSKRGYIPLKVLLLKIPLTGLQ